MTLSELIGSSLMFGLRGCTLNEDEIRADVDALKGVKCKGVILFDHDIAGNHHRNVINPEQLQRFIADLRHELGGDLIVAVDQEGGAVARLTPERGFLSTVCAEEFADWAEIDRRQYATNQAKQLRSLGIDLNLAPCVDLAIEPDSAIIAGKRRAFGEDHDTVVACAGAVIECSGEVGVRCCIKHYPGHGSTLIDTHMGMCDISETHSPEEERVYRTLIDRFGDSIAVMAGHLSDKRVDDRLPASVSPAHLTGRLRGTLGFDGVIISDSIDMRAVRDRFGEGRAALMALMAGCDLVIDGFNAPGYREPGGQVRIVNAISEAIQGGRWGVGEERLAQSRARIDRFMGRVPTR